MAAWQHSGMKITQVSAWVMVIHLVILDDQNREFGLVLISAHAPIGAAEEEEWYTKLFHTDGNWFRVPPMCQSANVLERSN